MSAIGDRLVILLIVATGLAGLFAWWSGFVEGVFGGWTEWGIRAVLAIVFLALIVAVWRRSRMTTADENE